jgi:hypothetical protein
MTSANGSSFGWQIAKSGTGGFDASFRVERIVGDQPYTEADELHTLSREAAVDWLGVEATVRGFDGRVIR